MPTYYPDLYRGVGMRCTEVPAADYFPILEQTGKKVIAVLQWVENLGY